MRYIEFGKNHKKLSTVILGMMRISSLSPNETEDLIEYVLRDGHRKRNGRFKGTHSFIDKCYLLALGREKRELLTGSRLLVQL